MSLAFLEPPAVSSCGAEQGGEAIITHQCASETPWAPSACPPDSLWSSEAPGALLPSSPPVRHEYRGPPGPFTLEVCTLCARLISTLQPPHCGGLSFGCLYRRPRVGPLELTTPSIQPPPAWRHARVRKSSRATQVNRRYRSTLPNTYAQSCV